MSEPSPNAYQLDQAQSASEQIRNIAAYAKTIGKTKDFARILRTAVQRMRNDPHQWGDPEFRAKTVDAVLCRGLVGPVVFRYVIYEQIHGVVLLSVKLYTDFA